MEAWLGLFSGTLGRVFSVCVSVLLWEHGLNDSDFPSRSWEEDGSLNAEELKGSARGRSSVCSRLSVIAARTACSGT